MTLRRVAGLRKTQIDSPSRLPYTPGLQRGVAQPGSAPALGAGGPQFKSGRPDIIENTGLLPVAQLDRAAAF